MKQAFSSSPSTKGTKESIAEVNRRYKEYTEVLNFGSELWAADLLPLSTVYVIGVRFVPMCRI